MLELRNRNCPVCSSSGYGTIGKPRRIDNVFLSIKDTNVSNCKIVQCKTCSQYFVQPFPFFSAELLTEMYSNANNYFQELTDRMERIIHYDNPERRFDTIEYYSKRPIRNYLEIGCGQGFGLQAARKRGWAVYGQDVSPDFADLVKKRTGINILVGPLKQDSYREGQFDVVYIDSVLEHIPNPVEYLSFVRGFLAADGIVYLTLPNEGSISNILMDIALSLLGSTTTSRMMPFSEPYHVLGFTKKSIRRLGETVGLAVRFLMCKYSYNHIERYKHPFSFTQLAKRTLYGACNQLFDAVNDGMNMEVVLMNQNGKDVAHNSAQQA